MVRWLRTSAPRTSPASTSLGAPQSAAEVAWLREQGVGAVVSLHPVPPEAAAAMRGQGLAHLEFPVQDFSQPLPGELADLVRFVEGTGPPAS